MVKRLSALASLFFRNHRTVSMTVQLVLVIASNRLAFLLRFDGQLPEWAEAAFMQMLPWVLGIRALTFVPFRLYQGLWRYTSLYDLQALAVGIVTSSAALFIVAQTAVGPPVYPRSIFIIDALLLTLLLGGVRLTRRILAQFSPKQPGRRVLVFGAGDAGEMIVRDMKNNNWYEYQPIGFVDDDRSKVGLRIHRVPVLGTRDDLPQILKRHKPDEVLIAIPRAEPAALRSIVRLLEPYKLPIKTLPNLRDIIDGKIEVGHIRNLAVEDLLSRAPIGLDPAPVKNLIRGRRVMVTGAGGSIGSELCRQIARLHPASLVLFERYENSLHAVRLELDDASAAFGFHAVVGDVGDANGVRSALNRFQPEIIFHAAAHKHVPLMEENPCEAIKNNVRGTRILAQAAEEFGVDRFVMISTDKAVNPTSVMGASKRLAELIVQAQAVGSGTSYSIVRFGNVLASNGSVVPRFLEQIKKGGPVTVTHPEMRRFFMLIPEAVQLVLHAAAQAQSGVTYVLEMGEQVKLADMARDLIRLSGLVPDEDVAIEFVGLRPGEKLYEELVGDGEIVTTSQVDKILCVTSLKVPDASLWSAVDQVEQLASVGQADNLIRAMGALIPAYRSSSTPKARVRQAAGAAIAATKPQVPGIHQPCPHCGGPLHRSRARSLPERFKKGFTAQRLFRCDDCGWRGWQIPFHVADAVPLDAPAAPDLSGLDALTPTPAGPARPSFSPRNL